MEVGSRGWAVLTASKKNQNWNETQKSISTKSVTLVLADNERSDCMQHLTYFWVTHELIKLGGKRRRKKKEWFIKQNNSLGRSDSQENTGCIWIFSPWIWHESCIASSWKKTFPVLWVFFLVLFCLKNQKWPCLYLRKKKLQKLCPSPVETDLLLYLHGMTSRQE